MKSSSQSQQPRISLIIPLYHVERDIANCLQSLLLQQLPLEIILVDDCSSDKSCAIAQRHADEAPQHLRISIHHHLNNRGPAAARNTGLRAATCDYIYYMDGDDTLPQGALKRLLQLAEQEQSDVCMGQFSTSHQQHITWLQADCPTHMQGEESLEQLLAGHIPQSAVNKLIKRNYLLQHHIQFNEQYRIHEDMLWCLNLMLSQPKISTSPQPSYNYQDSRAGSITQQIAKQNVLTLATQRQHIAQEYQQLAEQHQLQQRESYQQFYHQYKLSCIIEWPQVQGWSNLQRYQYYKQHIPQLPNITPKQQANKKTKLITYSCNYLPTSIAAGILLLTA